MEEGSKAQNVVAGILLVFSALLVGVTGLKYASQGPTPTPVEAREIKHTVVYSVTGRNVDKASITYQNEQGGTDQKTVFLPWSETFSVKDGASLYLSAQMDNDRGDIFVSLSVDGKVLQKAEASQDYGIASVKGTAR